MSYDDFFLLLEGDYRSNVKIRIKRGDEFVDIIVIPSEFRPPSIFVDSICSSTVMIAVKGFHPQTNLPGGTAEEFSEALRKNAWAENLVIDLRSNKGGYVDQSLMIVSELVPPNTPIITLRYPPC